jgi:hypothetical protein
VRRGGAGPFRVGEISVASRAIVRGNSDAAEGDGEVELREDEFEFEDVASIFEILALALEKFATLDWRPEALFALGEHSLIMHAGGRQRAKRLGYFGRG